MIRAQRFEYIMRQIKTNGVVSVAELTQALNASRSTIHRDLYDLEEQKQLKCIRGGAVSLSPKTSYEPTYTARMDFHKEEKQRIAQAALEYIQENDTVILDAGTTVLELAKLLKDYKNLYVATNDLHEAMELAPNNDITLVILGGMLRPNHYTINGVFTEDILKQIHADVTFLGVDAVDLDVGFMGFSLEELQSKRLMLKASQKKIVLCDHSKFSAIAFANICALKDVDLIITGREIDPEVLRRLQEAEVKVLTV